MKLTFLGAAGEVTGSQHLLETDHRRVLLDCGLFQGHRAESYAKNRRFHCNPKNLDAAILSHAHIDHCGNLPGLHKAGFRGPVFCTRATADVASIMLLDSARIQQEDARYLRTHLAPGHPPAEPLYDERDVRRISREFVPLDYGEWHELAPDFRLRFSDAGHILGSAITEIDVEDGGETKRVVFTGDLGRRNLPLLRDPQTVEGCDVLICESTYGNRVHPPPEDIRSELLRIITDAANNGGRVIIPAFSLGRTQHVIYSLNELTEAKLLPEIPVFVDSPLALRLTDVYRDHVGDMDQDATRLLKLDDDLFGFPMLTYLRTPQESASLNRRKGPFVVIAASGMCENGRVRHHLKHGVADARNTIVIIGFQAQHTLGRRLVERQPYVKIFDREYPLRAKVEILNGLSAHADVEDFKWWFERLSASGGAGRAFLVHGEPDAARGLAELIRDYCNEEPVVPALYASAEF
ncbi:MAG TPA: MBL fold metallo-hydrolase [Planctomycetaceae bacterium]|nr:MBL fold metallo-hydrolase [Planctomycetaceae bacterium]